MDPLKKLVLHVVGAERVGGRATVVNPRTLVLDDCMLWSCQCSDAVMAVFPEVLVSVRASRHSLSGFSVVFHLGQNCGRETGWYFVIGLFLAGCFYVLLNPPWWTTGIRYI
jgi:hypothetical protein